MVYSKATKAMLGLFRLVKNLFGWNRCLEQDRLRQATEGYSVEFDRSGPERYITYIENGRELSVLADFTKYNDVLLYTDSLRKWTKPRDEELSDFDYQKVLNRTSRYLSCWGQVTLDDSKLPDNEYLKRSLIEQGIPFTENADGVIQYEIDAAVYREQKRKGQI